MEVNDPRFDFLQDYTLKTLKLKLDKWSKFISAEENRILIQEFLDKAENINLVISANSAGALSVAPEFPTSLKNKAVYFVKKDKATVTKDGIKTLLSYGDLSYAPLDQLSALVDDIVVPLLSNFRNHDAWPTVVSQDVLRHVHNLKNSVYVVAGQVKGKTLLPLPVGTERVEQAIDVDEKGEPFDRALLHSVESVIIDWSHQIRDVLRRDSAQPLLAGQNPSRTWSSTSGRPRLPTCSASMNSYENPKYGRWQSSWREPTAATSPPSRPSSRMLLQP